MKELIEILVTALVDHPDQVDVSEVSAPDSVVYEVRVAEDDMGKVIGKGGKIANALRVVAKAAAMKEHRKVYVEIVR